MNKFIKVIILIIITIRVSLVFGCESYISVPVIGHNSTTFYGDISDKLLDQEDRGSIVSTGILPVFGDLDSFFFRLGYSYVCNIGGVRVSYEYSSYDKTDLKLHGQTLAFLSPLYFKNYYLLAGVSGLNFKSAFTKDLEQIDSAYLIGIGYRTNEKDKIEFSGEVDYQRGLDDNRYQNIRVSINLLYRVFE